MDFSLCPTYFRPLSSPDPKPNLCPDSIPLGRLVLGLYGHLVPLTVANFKSMCTSSAYKGTLVHKLFPGQFFLAGHQGDKPGDVRRPSGLARNTETVDSKSFALTHSRPGLLSLNLSENDDEDDIKLDPEYRNVEFLITTGETVRSMAIGAVFSDFGGKINSLDFHRKDDLLVTASEDDSVRLYDIATAKLIKTTFHKKHGADRICFTHHPSSVICSSKYNLDTTGESLRYLSMYDNRCLRYFKGHKERIVSLCMSPVNDSFMSGSLDHTVRIWDLRVNACQGILHMRGRPTVAYDQQGLVFAVAMEGGAIKLFDSRSYDKGPFDTFLVGGDTAEVCDIKFSNDGKSMLLTTTNNNIYVLDAYGGEKRCGYSVEPSPNVIIEATFTPDGQYVVSGSGDGNLHAWSINNRNEVACWDSHIGVSSCLKWAPRRAMFAAASSVLTFWIPNEANEPTHMETEAGAADPEHPSQ